MVFSIFNPRNFQNISKWSFHEIKSPPPPKISKLGRCSDTRNLISAKSNTIKEVLSNLSNTPSV